MKDENNVDKPQKEVTASLLDAFDLLKSPKDDLRITGGTKIIARLLENKVSLYFIFYKSCCL